MNRKLPHVEKRICARLRTMKNFIISRTNSVPVAEDIYAAACVTIWKKIRSGELRKEGSIDSFMWWCAKGAIRDYYRREKRYIQFTLDEYIHSPVIFARDSEREYELAIENRRFIKKMMKKVSVVCKKILILLLFQNMKLYEIAETLEIPMTTVSAYLRGMRNKFGVDLCRVRVQKKGVLDITAGFRGRWLMKKIGELDG